MNTADRSIGHIDYAVRRRFAFVQVLPDRKIIETYEKFSDETIREVALTLFDAVEKLFNKKEDSKEQGCLSPDYHKEDVQPGHSYFLVKSDDKDKQIEELAYKFTYQVWPLLKEYCKDGVLLCENENCKIEEIKINNKPLKLRDEVEPEKLVSAIKKLYESKYNKPQSEASEKEGVSQEESN